jgi:hypothetical protein
MLLSLKTDLLKGKNPNLHGTKKNYVQATKQSEFYGSWPIYDARDLLSTAPVAQQIDAGY